MIKSGIHIIIILLVSLTAVLHGEDLPNDNYEKAQAAYWVPFNRISLPINDNGMLGMNRSSRWPGICYIDTNVFMRTSNFFLSGKSSSGEAWVNGTEPISRFNDYIPGTVDESDDESQTLFYMAKDTEPFGIYWENWRNAVALGAEFYDGDNDGIYNPVDKNNNGVWDPDEDKPAMYGDVMTWSVFNDGAPAQSRRIKTVNPQGIEIRQTVWGYKLKSLEKVLFVKYSILNTGKYSASMDSVAFTLYVNPEVGFKSNDYLGSDVKSNSGYSFNVNKYFYGGDLDMSFFTSMLQGPAVETGDFEDEAYLLTGNELVEEKIQGSKNLPMTSFHKSTRAFPVTDVYTLRDYLLNGEHVEPCNDEHGEVFNARCEHIDKNFMYSGSVFKNEGWLNIRGSDQKYLQNTGNFKLDAGKPVEIIFTYTIGIAEDLNEALKDGFEINRNIVNIYYEQPVPPPAVDPITISNENSIELVWETSPYFDYSSKGYGYDLEFEGFEVYMHRTNSTLPEIGGVENRKLIERYDIWNDIDKILVEESEDFGTNVIYKDGIQLLKYSYSNPETGRILLKIDRDYFSNEPLIKGMPYFISVSAIAVDKNSLEPYGQQGTYLVPYNSPYGIVKSIPEIINDNKGNEGIVVGENLNDPFVHGEPLEHASGNSQAVITYSVYDREQVKDDLYELGFVKAEANYYSLYYYIRNLTTGQYIIDSALIAQGTASIQNLTDGFTIDLNWIEPGIKSTAFEGEEKWFKDFDNQHTGVFYVGKDLETTTQIFPVTDELSTAISAEDLAPVELHFGDSSYAYRYVRNAVRYVWNGAQDPDSGFAKIPVSAYQVNLNGEVRQLSMAFLENAFVSDTIKYPDGRWNPGASVKESKEYLVVFNSEYSEDYSAHPAYTGFQGKWANIAHGTWVNPGDNTLSDSLRMVMQSAWFDAMYVVGFDTEIYNPGFNPTGKLKIEPTGALTSRDKYVFRVKKDNTVEELQQQWDKVNVYPNPLFGYNASSQSFGYEVDEAFVTFSNLPPKVNIKIYSLSGTLVRELDKNDEASIIRWDLKNESDYLVASGLYIALIENPDLGQKVLKFSIIMPQKQIHFE